MTESPTTQPKYTDEQSAALSSGERAVALEAGAGCGKTFVLTERLIAHLNPLQSETPTVDEVIAITFTDAAAREMRDRLRKKCLDRLRSADADSRAAWLRLLRSLDAARVSTIHAFCGALLRSYAVDLGIDPSFAVLDQATADVMLSEVIDACLREGLENTHESTINLAAEYGLNGLKQRLRAMLAGRGEDRSAWLERSSQDAVDAWRGACDRLVHEQMKALSEDPALVEIEALLSQMVSEPTAKFAERVRVLRNMTPRLREGECDPIELQDLRAALNLQGVVARYWATPEEHARYKTAATTIRERLNKMPVLASEEVLHNAAEFGAAILRVTGVVADAYTAAKRDAGALDYDDLLSESHRLLTDSQYAGVQQSLRRGVRLLLVDEFQDTDHLQADLVRALVGLNEQEAPGDGRLFFVGDFKQSIYRFRGAEPAVFRQLQEETNPAGRLPLSTNFRSQPGVLSFVNHLFGDAFGDRYTPLMPARPQVTPTPATELLVTPPPSEQATATEKRQAEARAIARRLREMLDSGAPLVAESGADGELAPRPVRPGDIAILFQALGEVQQYEQALREQGIEYYLVGGHAFYSQQEVYDVLHLLRSIASGCDEIAVAGVLRSPMFALHDETLFWMVKQAGSLNASLVDRRSPPQLSQHESGKLARARETISELRAMKGCAPVAEVLRVAIERTGYDAVLLADFLGERKLANLHKLIEQARSSDASTPSGAGDLDRFIRQLGEFTLRQPKEALASTSSEGADVVRLMTVHRSKGLEFPVVVVPDLHRKSQSDRRTAALDADLGPLVKPARPVEGLCGLDLLKQLDAPEDRAESLRKLYVACTRAADYLLLSAVVDDSGALGGDWLTAVADRYDLETGQAKGSGPALCVNQGDASLVPRSSGGKRTDRFRLIEEARQALGQPTKPNPFTAATPLRPESLRQFSVSRLTGKLHQGRERPEAVALQAALRSKRNEVDPRGLGTLTHEVLERLPARVEVDAELIRNLCHELAPLHLRREAERAAEIAADMATRFTRSEPWASLCGADRFDREVEFLLRWPPSGSPTGEPDAWLRGYIDALAKDAAGRWWIVDFKTNQTDAAGVATLAEHYRLQLGVYALAVEQATGESPAGMRLCFLRPGEVVDYTWDAGARDHTRQLVTQAIAAVRADAVEPTTDS